MLNAPLALVIVLASTTAPWRGAHASEPWSRDLVAYQQETVGANDQRPQQADSWWIGLAMVLGVAEVLTIGSLVLQHSRRRRAQERVRSNERVLRGNYERVRQLAGGLINAQEAVWAKIARDLHDDVCQELAAVSMTLSDLKRREGRLGDVCVQDAIAGLQHRALNVLDGVRRLSHDLHPATLRQLGIVAAVDAQCVEIERTHGVHVGFAAQGDLRGLEQDLALSLFRIAQEGLRNAATHANARRISVSIIRDGDDVELRVADDGRGFDPAAVRQSTTGLGLVSMEERAHLLDGQVTVRARPGHGVEITVRVPARIAGAGSLPRPGHEASVPNATAGSGAPRETPAGMANPDAASGQVALP